MNCSLCGGTPPATDNGQRTWWQLSNYFGLTGRYCPDCYDGVAHDPYGKPNNEGKYLAALAAQRLEKSCNSASVK